MGEAEPLGHGLPGDDAGEAADGVDAPRRHRAVAIRVPVHAPADDFRECGVQHSRRTRVLRGGL